MVLHGRDRARSLLEDNKSRGAVQVPGGQIQWTAQPSLGHARAGLAGATVNGEIFAIGGFSFTELFDVVEARSTGGAGQWRDVTPSMPTPRANVSTAELDGIIYAIGGIGGGDVSLDVVEQYDPAASSWTTGVPLPEPRVAP